MTRAGRSGTSTARGTFAGRTVAGGLSSGTVAHGGHGCPTTKGPGWAVDAARPGRDPHARVFEGVRIASGPVVHRVRGGAMAARDGLRARTAPWDAGRPLAAGMPRVFERRAGCSGTVVHLGRGFGDPGPGVALVSEVVCPRQRPFRIPPPPHPRRDRRRPADHPVLGGFGCQVTGPRIPRKGLRSCPPGNRPRPLLGRDPISKSLCKKGDFL
jgi:hypothetical protein